MLFAVGENEEEEHRSRQSFVSIELKFILF